MIDILKDHFKAPSDPNSVWTAWQEHFSPFFDLTRRDETDLNDPPALKSYHLGHIIVGDVQAPAQNLERSERLVGRQGLDHILIQFYRTGASEVRSARGTNAATASQCIIYDLSQPVTVASYAAVAATSIVLPRAMLSEQAGSLDAYHGMSLDCVADPVGRLFRAYVEGLVTIGDRLHSRQLAGLARAASSLCEALLPAMEKPGPATARRMSIEIRQFIHDRLCEPDLDADMIAAHFGLSRATLYRQFAAADGVQNYIRERRLMRAMRLLTRGGTGGRPRVSSVAYAVGFSDETTFSRAFKRRFGILPRDASTAAAYKSNAVSGAPALLTWISHLTPPE